MQQSKETNSICNICNVLFHKAKLDEDNFEKSYEKLLEKHSALKIIFKIIDNEPKQLYSSNGRLVDYYEKIDLSNDLNKKQRLNEIFENARRHIFNLEKASHYFKLIKYDAENYYFLFNIHHIIADLWSLKILLQDLLQIYQNKTFEIDNSIANHQIEYHDYVIWLNNRLENNHTKYEEYWRKQFAGSNLPILNLNYSFPEPLFQNIKPYFDFTIEEEITEKVYQFINHKEVSLYSFLLAMVYTFLYKNTGDKDIIVGSPVAGRIHPDTENVVGLFINMLPFRFQIDEESSFALLLQNVKQLVFLNLEFQEFPLDRIIDPLKQSGELKSTLFDVTLVLQNVENKNKVYNSHIEEISSNVSHDNLSFLFTENNQRLNGTIEFRPELFTIVQIEQMAEQFNQLLNIVLDDSSIKMIDLEF